MTQIYTEDGKCIPVTIIKAGPCYITQLKVEDKDKYNAIQLGFDEVKEKSLNKPLLGHLKKFSCPALRYLSEFRCEIEDITKYHPGDKIGVEIFKEGEFVDVSGITKGRGFTGVVKRWGFSGQPASHGESQGERAPGSLGRQQSIGKGVYKGKKMAGRYGNEKVTVKNLLIAKIIPEENLLLVKGAVPGPNGRYVKIKRSLKNDILLRKRQKIEFYEAFAPPKAKKVAVRDLDTKKK